jgi:hypothetical protein
MFADTLTITINSVAKVLTRINQDGYASEYLLRTSTEQFSLKLRNSQYTDKTRAVKVDRHNIELVQTVFPVSPATVSTVRKYYSVLENDASNDIAADAKFGAGATAFQTEANFTKMLNWES